MEGWYWKSKRRSRTSCAMRLPDLNRRRRWSWPCCADVLPRKRPANGVSGHLRHKRVRPRVRPLFFLPSPLAVGANDAWLDSRDLLKVQTVAIWDVVREDAL